MHLLSVDFFTSFVFIFSACPMTRAIAIVILSICPSVCPSVTLAIHAKMVRCIKIFCTTW